MSERETPTNDPELDADPRVIALLQSGSPSNGIDVAPWWRANAASLAVPPKQKSWALSAWSSLAAVFLVGVALGFAGANSFHPAPAVGGSPNLCQYSEEQRNALISLLDAVDKLPAPDWRPKRTTMLTLCSGCHLAPPAVEPIPAFKDRA
jgi:hypothetical protein